MFDVYHSMQVNAFGSLANGLFNSSYRNCPTKKMIIIMPSPIIVALAV
jgi:hypothetical protein